MVFKMQSLTAHFSWEEFVKGNPTGATIYVTKEALLQATMLEEFRVWLGRPMTVNCWYRTESYNKAVGGIATSNHLKGKATDIGYPGISKDTFIKYAKKWKEICKAHGVVGEAGIYTWGYHLGISNARSFQHWDTRTGVQKNNPFII